MKLNLILLTQFVLLTPITARHTPKFSGNSAVGQSSESSDESDDEFNAALERTCVVIEKPEDGTFSLAGSQLPLDPNYVFKFRAKGILRVIRNCTQYSVQELEAFFSLITTSQWLLLTRGNSTPKMIVERRLAEAQGAEEALLAHINQIACSKIHADGMQCHDFALPIPFAGNTNPLREHFLLIFNQQDSHTIPRELINDARRIISDQ